MKRTMKNTAAQQGFVSLIAATILMIILTLVTIGFSRVMQREQRQALDRQLSSQAFYAAETAINDAAAYIEASPTVVPEKPDCDVSAAPWNGGVIRSGDTTVAYTCLQIDPTPTALEFNNVITPDQSKIFPIQPRSGGPIESVTFQWNGTDGTNDIRDVAQDCSNQVLPSARSDSVPMLRIDLISVPIPAINPATTLPFTNTVTRAALDNGAIHVFLYPQTGCGSTTTSYATHTGQTNAGQLVNVSCTETNPYACSLTVDGISVGATNRMYARVRSIYRNANMRVTATTANPVEFEFVGAQTTVDATGKANDVLRRVKAHLSDAGTYPVPEYVVQSMDGVCKQLAIAPPSTVEYGCY